MAASNENETSSEITNQTSNNSELKDILFDRQRKFVCVEFPGFVKNESAALEMLGGIDKINKVYSEDLHLPLKWRPKDVYCKPAFGEKATPLRLLMKVTRKANKDDPKQYDVGTEVIGSIPTSYKFTGACDFQYLPMVKTDDQSYKSLTDSLLIKDPIDVDEFLRHDTPMYLPPQIFSKIDKPGTYAYRPANIKYRVPAETSADKQKTNVIGSFRKRARLYGIILNFDAEGDVPSEPNNAHCINEFNKLDADFKQKVTKLFEERPIWTRLAFDEEAQIPYSLSKFILPAIAYHWKSGPWHRSWCRYGYDPRKDANARKYQTIDFRIRMQGESGQNLIPNKRSTMSASALQPRRGIKSGMLATVDSFGTIKREMNASDTQSESEKERSYIFRPNTLPPYRNVAYQLCDVNMSAVQQLAATNCQIIKCDVIEGWFIEGTIAQFRKILLNQTYSLINKLLSVDGKEPHTSQTDEGVEQLDLSADKFADTYNDDEDIDEDDDDDDDIADEVDVDDTLEEPIDDSYSQIDEAGDGTDSC